MTERNFEHEIEKLKTEIETKEKEIRKCLDKIESLEEAIMDFEENLSEESDKADKIILLNQVRHLENYNRELKDKMGFLRLENVRLKKKLEESKKGYYDQLSLIKVVENDKSPPKLKKSINYDSKGNGIHLLQKPVYNDVEIKCPLCKTKNILKIPTSVINPSLNLTTINIPIDFICEHSFQILIDKSFIVKKYQIENNEFNKIELSNNKKFTTEILSKMRTFIDDIEILGIALFNAELNVIFASIPSNSLYNLFDEINLRRETSLHDITKSYVELIDQQKYFLESFEIGNVVYILVLLFSQRVNFGMGTMLFKDVKDKLIKLFINHKEGLT